MNFNLIHWLFDDPYTAGTNAGLTGPETFHYLYPWLIFCSVGVLIAFYYSVEGRKRFVKNKPIIKYMLDRYLGWLRSEEHTSELQSRPHLVCRLLLEKKKQPRGNT